MTTIAARGLLWLWRGWMLLLAGVATAQPVLAGAYLQGDYDAIGWHGVLGSAALPTLVLGAAVLAIVAVLVLRTPVWSPLLGAALLVAVGMQIGLGHSRSLLAHVPLGVGIVLACLAWTVWVCSPRACRGRRRTRAER